jgi:hypothetical protein
MSESPGLCPLGKVQGKEILCRSTDVCEYQLFDPGPLPVEVYCGREAAALVVAEQPEEP